MEDNMKKKIVTIIGARPQFIKAAVVSDALKEDFDEVIVHTGQHFDKNMSDIFFEELKIKRPKYNLGISGGSHGSMTAKMLESIEKVLIDEKPDMVLLYGDTNSTLAGALAAVKLNVTVAHVEAGCRMGTLSNPEEVNRIVTDHVSSILFPPSEIEYDNLKKEGLADKSFIVGNTMYDAFLHYINMPWDKETFRMKTLTGEEIYLPDRYYYLTCHRQENTQTDENLNEILSAMESLEYPTVYPVHPRNKERALRLCKEKNYNNIILIEPVGYIESIHILDSCEKVVTDSGGLQTEAFFAEKKCVTVLDNIVWPQTLAGNRNTYCKPIMEDILKSLTIEQNIDRSYKPYGDGEAVNKILEQIKAFLC